MTNRTDIKMMDAWEKCVLFNNQFGVGSTFLLDGKEVKTTSEAYVVVSTPSVQVANRSAPVSLTELHRIIVE